MLQAQSSHISICYRGIGRLSTHDAHGGRFCRLGYQGRLGLGAILYSSIAHESQRLLFGEEVPVIRNMGQLPEHLGSTNPRFEPCFVSRPGQLVIEGIGIDIVTEPRHCLRISKETVLSHAENMGRVLGSVSEKHYGSAMSRLEEMIRAIAKAAMPIDETAIQISYPG